MEIDINTNDDLLEFIKRKDVTLKQAHDVSLAYLRVLSIFEYESKEHLIASVEDFIKRWGNEQCRPIFIDQLNEHFMIEDIAKNHFKHEKNE
jgi:hypothetical protein